MKVFAALASTIRHFFPCFNDWLKALPDSRLQPACIYPRQFLAWWALMLYLLQLSSRRALDFDLSPDSKALANVNRLAHTQMRTRPVHDTMDHFLGHTQASAFAGVRRHMVYALIRSKALDSARVQGRLLLLIDGTGLLTFTKKHCEHCLVQKHEKTTVYMHQVLEAKILGPAGMVLSCGTAFIENAADPGTGSAEQRKQDCELKALDRLGPQVKKDFPQTRFCLVGDSEFGCGRVLALCKDLRWSFLLVFKPGRTPALYREFLALLEACPGNRLEREADGVKRVYRWVNQLQYRDSANRDWEFNALLLQETVDGETKTFAWITDLVVDATTVQEVAQAGRDRWRIENEGFNEQKNSGLNLQHVYSLDEEKLKCYYYILQIAHIMNQLFVKGSLLRNLARAAGKTLSAWLGGLKYLAKRLLEGIRDGVLGEPGQEEPVGQIRFQLWDSS